MKQNMLINTKYGLLKTTECRQQIFKEIVVLWCNKFKRNLFIHQYPSVWNCKLHFDSCSYISCKALCIKCKAKSSFSRRYLLDPIKNFHNAKYIVRIRMPYSYIWAHIRMRKQKLLKGANSNVTSWYNLSFHVWTCYNRWEIKEGLGIKVPIGILNDITISYRVDIF